MKHENGAGKSQINSSPEACRAPDRGASRRLGGVLLGVGGAGAFLALLCCAAPWLLGGLLVTLGLGFVLKDSVLLPLAAAGLVVAGAGWWLMRRRASVGGRTA